MGDGCKSVRKSASETLCSEVPLRGATSACCETQPDTSYTYIHTYIRTYIHLHKTMVLHSSNNHQSHCLQRHPCDLPKFRLQRLMLLQLDLGEQSINLTGLICKLENGTLRTDALIKNKKKESKQRKQNNGVLLCYIMLQMF